MSLLYFAASQASIQNFNLWVSGCPHCIKDRDDLTRDSIAVPLSQIDAGAFDFDLGIMLGDFADGQVVVPVTDTNNGEEVSTQMNSSGVHDVAKIYPLMGNHDAGQGEVDWYLRYVDPVGANTAYSGVDSTNRPYPITWMDDDSNNWHSYYITVGNVRIIMLSDRNELPGPWGRGDGDAGGLPSGTMSLDTWTWVKTLLADTSRNYIISSHMNPRDTTIATIDGTGVSCGYHGTSGISAGSGSLYSIYDEDTPGNTEDATDQFLDYFTANPNHTVCMWIGSHTHYSIGATCSGKGNKYTESGVQYLNISSLTKAKDNGGAFTVDPKSWLFNINNSRINCKMYLHMESVGTDPIGWYAPEEFNVDLKV